MGETSICRILPWDSSFFGLRIARMEGSRLTPERVVAAEGWCAEQGVDCLYFLADADDERTVSLAEGAGFHLADLRVTYERALGPGLTGPAPASGLKIRPAEASDVAALAAIARDNHRDTRFFFDARFSQERAAELYAIWIANSCERYADAVLVAETGGAPAGYITCHLEQSGDGCSIGLLGVGPAVRGRGAGRALVDSALVWFGGHGRTRVSVVTQGRNVAAQRLYQRAGFVTAMVQLWYHRWPAAI